VHGAPFDVAAKRGESSRAPEFVKRTSPRPKSPFLSLL